MISLPGHLMRVHGVPILLAGLALASRDAAAQAPAPDRARLVRSIDSLAADAVSSGRMASASVAVVRGADTLTMQAWGQAQRETSRPASAATVYRLGSIAKQFTSAIVLQLVAEGKLSLADTLGKHLPWVPAAWRGVTLPQLLNHTSGIPSYTGLGPAWASRMTEDMTPDTIIALTAARPMDFAPGTGWRYNNTGYAILGRIIELVDRKPYAQSVQDRIARPLGLASLRYCPTSPDPARDAFPYANAPGRTFVAASPISLTQPYAAGALCSTARDQVKWNAALHGGKVVRADLYSRMTTPEGAASSPNRYGFGIVRDTTRGVLTLLHGGGINGFVTVNAYSPASGLSVVVLANTETGEVDRVAAQITRLLNGQPLVQRAVPVTLTAAQLAPLAGRYEITLPGRAIPMTMRVEGSTLVAQLQGQPPFALVATAPDRFHAEIDENVVFEFVFEGGKVAGATLVQGQRIPVKRLPE